MRSPFYVAPLASLLALSSCQRTNSAGAATPEQPAAASAAAPKVDFDALLRREAGELSAQSVAAPDRSWTAEAQGSAAPTIKASDETTSVEVPIGSEAPMRCLVYKDSIDPGGTIHSMLSASKNEVEYQRVAPTAFAVVGGVPTTFVEGIYLVPGPQGKMAGHLKVAVHAREGAASLCVHDEVGYRETFAKSSKAFFQSFKLAQASAVKPKFYEVSRTRLGDADVGFSLTRVVPGEGAGELRYEQQAAMFLPRSATELVTSDNYTVLEIDSKGRLKKGTWAEGQAGQLQLQVVVTRVAEGKYAYEGTSAGAPLKGEFTTKKALATPLDSLSLVRKSLKANKPFSTQLLEYYPGIDPKAATVVTYSHEKQAAPREVTIQAGALKFVSQMDAQGVPEDTLIPMGSSNLRVSRELVEGSL